MTDVTVLTSILQQVEQAFRGSPDRSLVPEDPDGSLQQGRMLGHFLDQETVGLGAAQALLAEGPIVAAQNLSGLHSQHRESLFDFFFAQGLLGVFPVSVRDPLFF